MALPFDTTVHAIVVHLYVFSESLELQDLTTGTTIFKARVTHLPDQRGLAHLEALSSPEGIPVYKDHDDELVSVYSVPDDMQVNAMGVMNLWLWDKAFGWPSLR